jgi:hypothetical protein
MNTLPKEQERKHIVRSELNIERWSSMFATSQYKGRSREVYRQIAEGKTIGVVVGKQRDDRGRLLEVGVLRVPALKVFYALIRLWELAGRPDNAVNCTLPQLRRVLGKALGGQTYEYLRTMLESLHHIPIKWIGSFYQKDIDKLETIEDGFHILSTLKFYEVHVGKELRAAAVSFKFHDRILRISLTSTGASSINSCSRLCFSRQQQSSSPKCSFLRAEHQRSYCSLPKSGTFCFITSGHNGSAARYSVSPSMPGLRVGVALLNAYSAASPHARRR